MSAGEEDILPLSHLSHNQLPRFDLVRPRSVIHEAQLASVDSLFSGRWWV